MRVDPCGGVNSFLAASINSHLLVSVSPADWRAVFLMGRYASLVPIKSLFSVYCGVISHLVAIASPIANKKNIYEAKNVTNIQAVLNFYQKIC